MLVYLVVGAFVVFILLALVFGRRKGGGGSNTWDTGDGFRWRRRPRPGPIVSGWNYMVRLCRPRDEIINGGWVFPAAQVVS